MNRFHPKKLLNSKWTAVQPLAKQKHFIVIEVEVDEETSKVLSCTLEAVMTKKQTVLSPGELKDILKWQQGWR